MKGWFGSGFGVTAAAMLAVMALLSSCSGKQDQPVVKPAEEQTPKKLKVAYFNQQEFNLVYGNALKKLLPDYEFEVIPSVKIENQFSVPVDPEELMKQKPDLIFGLTLVQQLSKSGKVMELTPLLKQDNYDLNQLTSAAVEQSRAIGGGRLTNLSPTFNATGLYYNKDMFDRFGIPYPTNRMTWPSLLELAKKTARIENGKQLYGIYTNYLSYSVVQSYAKGVGAEYLSADKRKAMYASDAYVSAISTGVDALKSNAVYLPPENQVPAANKKEMLLQNKFIAGEAAMSIYNTGLIETINDAAAQGIAPIKWDVVTGPVKADKPNESLFAFVVNDPVAIAMDSPNKTAAWTFVKTLMGREMALELDKLKSRKLSTRGDSVLMVDGRRLDAFYMLGSTLDPESAWPQLLSQKVIEMTREELLNVIYDRKRAADGLTALEKRVQQAIDDEFAAKK